MILKKVLLALAVGLVAAAWACSHGTAPTEPSTVETAKPAEAAASNPHGLWGLYAFACDPAAGTVDIQPLRDAELHVNALHFLEPPLNINVTLESKPKINGNILDIDIGLHHPFLGQNIYTGFDVCGIMFTHGSITGFSDPDIIMPGEGDTRLLNADGYTRWWNPAEFPHGSTIFTYINGLLGTPAENADFNCTLNAYKYFADGLDKDVPLTTLDPSSRGVFSAGAKNIRHYKIDMSGGLIFNYAVDACWKKPKGTPPYTVPDDFPSGANRWEAWNASVTELDNTLFYDDSDGSAGGELKLLIDVYDHFNAALNKVSAESLSGLPCTSSPGPIGGGEGYSTYQLDFIGGSLTKNEDAELFITVESEAIGYGGILPGEPVSTYFVWHFGIFHHPTGTAWARTWGGVGYDKGLGVAIDGSGNTYVTGLFSNTVDFDPGPGVDEHTSNGDTDIFLSKFNSDGEFQWARTWGGFITDAGSGLAIDGNGNIYVTGLFSNNVDFDPGPGVDEHTSNGSEEIFLSKFDSSGEFLWAHTWGGEYADWGNAVGIDGSGNAYITGDFEGTVDFDPGTGADERTSKGAFDIFLSKFNSNGDFQWACTWGGSDADLGNGIAVDASGNAYVAGLFEGTVDFDPGPGVDEHTSNGYGDIFLSKFSSSGEFQWARTWGGVNYDEGYGVAINGSADAYVTGFFQGTADFDPGPGVDVHTTNGSHYVFMSKLNSNGDFQGARTWGGDGDDVGYGIAVDGNGNAYVTGFFQGTADFDPGPGVKEHTSNGLADIFLSKFDSNGDFQWARSWGGGNNDYGNGVAIDGSGNAFVTGGFRENVDFDPGPGVDEHTSNGGHDIFLSKFPPDGNW